MTLIEWMACVNAVGCGLWAVVATVRYRAAVAELRKTTRDLRELHGLAENVRKKLAEYERQASAFRSLLTRRASAAPSANSQLPTSDAQPDPGPSWP